MFWGLLGALTITTIFYNILRLVLLRIIVIETHRIFISVALASIIAEVIWFINQGFISLFYVLSGLIIFIIVLINYNLKIKRANKSLMN